MPGRLAEYASGGRQSRQRAATPSSAAGVTNAADVAAARASGPRTQEVERGEDELIEATCRGETDAFEALVARHLSRALAVAYRVVGQREDAEDVVQDAFLAALVKIETFDRGRPFAPWLLRIVANRAINLRKARSLRRTELIDADTTSDAASPFDEAVRSELRGELQRALAGLPEQQRWIVELFEIDGFTGPEIAEMLDMPEGTVRWHVHQGRHALRAALAGASRESR